MRKDDGSPVVRETARNTPLQSKWQLAKTAVQTPSKVVVGGSTCGIGSHLTSLASETVLPAFDSNFENRSADFGMGKGVCFAFIPFGTS